MFLKKIYIAVGAAVALMGYSCTKADTYPGPDSAFEGNIIDSVTGKNMLTETGGLQIELRQISWTANPSPYDIPSKPDGTFEDTRIFSGHYNIIPTKGPFWPVADSTIMDIRGNTTHDFRIVPYLEIVNVTHVQAADSLVMSFQLVAPRTVGLPQILDATLFVNNTPYVGSGANIQSFYNQGSATAKINSGWNAGIAATTYRVVVYNLQPGWTYYARVGVRVNDSYKKYNLSHVVQVVMPPGK
jgi:hypothetical protein